LIVHSPEIPGKCEEEQGQRLGLQQLKDGSSLFCVSADCATSLEVVYNWRFEAVVSEDQEGATRSSIELLVGVLGTVGIDT
jgi:hypothetical protein